jgi:hypothetical protein
MKGEECEFLQGVADEEQRGRQQEAELIEDWIRKCPVKLSARELGAIRLLVELDD